MYGTFKGNLRKLLYDYLLLYTTYLKIFGDHPETITLKVERVVWLAKNQGIYDEGLERPIIFLFMYIESITYGSCTDLDAVSYTHLTLPTTERV